MKREVLEEAGLDFEPEALVAVEYQSFYWIRFTLTGWHTHTHTHTHALHITRSLFPPL